MTDPSPASAMRSSSGGHRRLGGKDGITEAKADIVGGEEVAGQSGSCCGGTPWSVSASDDGCRSKAAVAEQKCHYPHPNPLEGAKALRGSCFGNETGSATSSEGEEGFDEVPCRPDSCTSDEASDGEEEDEEQQTLNDRGGKNTRLLSRHKKEGQQNQSSCTTTHWASIPAAGGPHAVAGLAVSNRLDSLSHSQQSSSPLCPVRAIKSYDNTSWIHSRAARHVRIMCEYLEVQDRMRHQQVMCTILVFGSARCYSEEQWKEEMRQATAAAAKAATSAPAEVVNHVDPQAAQASKTTPLDGQNASSSGSSSGSSSISSRNSSLQAAEARIRQLRKIKWLSTYWEKTYRLSTLLMEWVRTREARKAIAKLLREVPSPAGGSTDEYAAYDADHAENPNYPDPVALCTGGGPGLMEAANRAAYETPGARSMGMGISLPFEPGLNPFVHKELAFEFHYFFTRKFWMLYSALALIATPGGLGTMDELMEVLTLKQTGKFKRDIPVVLLGKEFWKTVINFDALVDYGTITEPDRDQMFYTDSPEEAFEYIKNHILADKLLLKERHVHKSNRGPATGGRTTTAAATTTTTTAAAMLRTNVSTCTSSCLSLSASSDSCTITAPTLPQAPPPHLRRAKLK